MARNGQSSLEAMAAKNPLRQSFLGATTMRTPYINQTPRSALSRAADKAMGCNLAA